MCIKVLSLAASTNGIPSKTNDLVDFQN